jgi:hypothetical protein
MKLKKNKKAKEEKMKVKKKEKEKKRERYFTVHTVQNTTVTYQRQLFRTHKILSLHRNGIQSKLIIYLQI